MKKYIFFTFFIFSGICLAQYSSTEEELKHFGADDFFINDNKFQKTTDTSNAIKTVDTIQAGGSQQETAESESDEKNTVRNSVRRQSAPSSAITSSMPVGMKGPIAADTNIVQISIFDTAGVSEEHSFDFLQNLSQYRSPQKALFYSLLLPGLGQAYNKKYWRTALYAAIEIGMITGAIHFGKEADKISKNAKDFAKNHFDKDNLEKFYKELTDYGYDILYPYSEDSINVGEYIFNIFSDTRDTSGSINKYAYQDYLEEPDSDFYGSIYGVHGWDDANKYIKYGNSYPYFYDVSDSLLDTTTYLYLWVDGKKAFGFSGNQNTYLSLIKESKKQGNYSRVFIVGIFVNHIASATDAFVSAIIHNRKLLKEEKGERTKAEDVLSRISINGDMYLDRENVLTSKLSFTWRF